MAWAKTHLTIPLNLVAVGLLVLATSPQTRAVGAGDEAPPWQGTDLISERKIAFPQVLDGKPAVLVFWATWCPYCKAFMPYAGEIQQQYSEQGVKIISFNAKERDAGDPRAYSRSLGFELLAIADADAIADAYDVKFIPGLMVVDGDGKVTYRRGWTDLPAGSKVAAQWAEEVRGALDALLD